MLDYKYLVYYRRSIWDDQKYNFRNCEKFCALVRVHLQHTLVQFPSPTRCRILAQEFEAFHGIPHIIREIDGFHSYFFH